MNNHYEPLKDPNSCIMRDSKAHSYEFEEPIPLGRKILAATGLIVCLLAIIFI